MNDQATTKLLALLYNEWTLYTGVGIFFTIRVLSAVKFISNMNLYRRMLPFLPEALGVAAVFLGSVPSLNDSPTIHKVFGGLGCAWLSKFARKILGQTILGDDKQITAKKSVAQIAAEELKEPEQQ